MSKNNNPQADSSNAVVARVVSEDVAPDGLPVVMAEAAAIRASQFIGERGLGPNATELVAYIASRAVDTADLNVVILEQLADRLLNATTPEDILTPFDPNKGQDYIGETLIVTGATFLESEYSEGFPWFVSLQITLEGTGGQTVVTVGGEKLVMQVAAFDRLNAWPQRLRIHKATKATKAGFYPLELRAA